MSARTTVAAFDFDGTLSTQDCVVPFLRRFLRRWPVLAGVLRHSPQAVMALARRDRDGLRAAATSAVLAGVSEDDLLVEAEAFAHEVVSTRLRGDTKSRLEWHLAQGHRVVIVSASYEIYLNPIALSLGVESVLGTRLAVDPSGVLTGQLDGRNCRADEKETRLSAWLAAERLERDDIDLWAYGDSNGDKELLAFADHSIWVTEPLASVAAT